MQYSILNSLFCEIKSEVTSPQYMYNVDSDYLRQVQDECYCYMCTTYLNKTLYEPNTAVQHYTTITCRSLLWSQIIISTLYCFIYSYSGFCYFRMAWEKSMTWGRPMFDSIYQSELHSHRNYVFRSIPEKAENCSGRCYNISTSLWNKFLQVLNHFLLTKTEGR
jgi:hypothetical protein